MTPVESMRSRPRVRGPEIRNMFARIVHRYDLLNHLLSFQIDRYWRMRAVRRAQVEESDRVLDVCAGTGDLAIALAKRAPRGSVVASDFCTEMLSRIAPKAERKGLGGRIGVGTADCQRLPFEDASFDVVTVAFGIRNVADPGRGLDEMTRVLAPGGRLVILEFSYPESFVGRVLYGGYRCVIPAIGKLFLGGDEEAYRYLNESVRDFASRVKLDRLLEERGLANVRRTTHTLGIAQIVSGERPPERSGAQGESR